MSREFRKSRQSCSLEKFFEIFNTFQVLDYSLFFLFIDQFSDLLLKTEKSRLVLCLVLCLLLLLLLSLLFSFSYTYRCPHL